MDSGTVVILKLKPISLNSYYQLFCVQWFVFLFVSFCFSSLTVLKCLRLAIVRSTHRVLPQFSHIYFLKLDKFLLLALYCGWLCTFADHLRILRWILMGGSAASTTMNEWLVFSRDNWCNGMSAEFLSSRDNSSLILGAILHVFCMIMKFEFEILNVDCKN